MAYIPQVVGNFTLSAETLTAIRYWRRRNRRRGFARNAACVR